MSGQSVVELCTRYLDAWARRDLDGILALHHPDSTYRLHVVGEQEAAGLDAVRSAFASVFETWPDLAFTTSRIRYGTDFFAHEMDVWGTASGVVGPEGVSHTSSSPVHYDMADIVEVRDGQIYRKDTYVDALAIMAATTTGDVRSR